MYELPVGSLLHSRLLQEPLPQCYFQHKMMGPAHVRDIMSQLFAEYFLHLGRTVIPKSGQGVTS